jgi:hypothetical protein
VAPRGSRVGVLNCESSTQDDCPWCLAATLQQDMPALTGQSGTLSAFQYLTSRTKA